MTFIASKSGNITSWRIRKIHHWKVMDKVISTKWGQNLMEEHMLLTIQGKFPNLFNISSNLSSIGQQTRIQYLKSNRKRACVVKKMNQDIHEITQSIREKMVFRNWYS